MGDPNVLDAGKVLGIYASQKPNNVIPRLDEGATVLRGWGSAGSYVIDDIDGVLSGLDGLPENLPYGDIHNRLEPDTDRVEDLFGQNAKEVNGRHVAPFSTVIRNGVGACLEKAMLTQLALQCTTGVQEHYLIPIGSVKQGEYFDPHAFNLAKRNGAWFLIDTQIPLSIDENHIVRPYIAPVLGINSRKGHIAVREDWQLGRTYSLV
ncbi:MAG: hypothetical protein HY366_02285 [Candidatus Aenigmarchaeota archaeon]|nr:hypothetical protein [Candidatus Aenigmarchaeota archaeon]